jgi:hypothetical protein
MKHLEAKQKLIDLQKVTDLEVSHIKADEILLSLLSDLGFDDIVQEYQKIDKWYA